MFLCLLAAGTGRDKATAAAVEPLGPVTVGEFAREHFAAVVDQDVIPGAVFAVVQGGQVIFHQGFGMADLATSRPVRSDDTVFRVGSVSKVLTAAAVMQLVEAGRLDLDRDVNQYLDRIRIGPAFHPPITLHHLLTHTSGFDVRVLRVGARFPETAFELSAYLEKFLPERVRPPGLFYSYDNYGFTLAGYLVRKATGTPFAVHVQKSLLEPLGMRSSSFRPGRNLRARLATGYWHDGTELRSYSRDQVNIVPAAGLSATGQDMARLMIALLGRRPPGAKAGLAKPVRQALLTPQFAVHDLVPGRCYGFNQVLLFGRRVLRQGGRWPGCNSVMLLFPEQNAGLFLAYNLADRFAFGRKISRSFVDQFIPPPMPGPANHTEPHPPKARVERLAGVYVSTRYPELGPRLGPRREIRVDTVGTNLVINGQPFRWLEGKVYGRSGVAPGEETAIGSERLAFWPEEASTPSHLVTDRASYRRAGWWETRRGRERALVCILVVLSWGALWWPLAGGLRWLSVIRRHERAPPLAPGEQVGRGAAVVAKGVAGFACWFALWYLLALARSTAELEPLAFLYGLPDEHRALWSLAPVLALLSVGLLICGGWAWWFRAWHVGERILYSLVVLSLLLLCLGLHQRNLLFSQPQTSARLGGPPYAISLDPQCLPALS